MAASLNKVTLIGTLGKDPEIRSFSSGGRIASFSVATSESWKDKSTGEKKEKTEWHRITVKNDALVGIVEKHLKKGMSIYLEGKLETRKWQDKDGYDRYTTEIVLVPYHGEIKILTWPKDKSGDTGAGDVDDSVASNSTAQKDAKGSPVGGFSNGGNIDDEIPF